MQLNGSSPCRNGEVQTVDVARLEQAHVVPKSGFRLARAGFRFENDDLCIEVGFADDCLLWIGCREAGEHGEGYGVVLVFRCRVGSRPTLKQAF